MSQEVKIKDWQGRVIGKIEIDNNGNKRVKDFYGRVLGKYDKSLNLTKDFYGRVVAKGDHCDLLISMNPNK